MPASISAQTEPLPLLPVTWTTRKLGGQRSICSSSARSGAVETRMNVRWRRSQSISASSLAVAASSRALAQLEAAGLNDVAHLDGGLGAWKAAHLPTTIDITQPISIMRQVQITAGSLVVLGAVLAALVSPWFILLSGFVGAGLVFAGVTDTCMMAMLLSKLPYNRPRPAVTTHQTA